MARRSAQEEREDVLAFLRAEEVKHEQAASIETDALDVAMRLRAKASILRTVLAYFERGDHVGSAKGART